MDSLDAKINDMSRFANINIVPTCRVKNLSNNSKPTDMEMYYYGQAAGYYTKKLKANAEMSVYNHNLAALYSEVGESQTADLYYKNALANAPGNAMIRNDYALHLSKSGHQKDAVDEFRKSMLVTTEQPVLRKNLGAVLARSGQYMEALEHTKRSLELNDNDAMAHRNMARIKDALGDATEALKHNRIAIEIESRGGITNKSVGNCSAYRSAAVQIISRGGSHEEALSLIDQAREMEGRKFVLPTTQRTNEVISMIVRRTGDKKAELEREKAAVEAKKRQDAEAKAQQLSNTLSKLTATKKAEEF